MAATDDALHVQMRVDTAWAVSDDGTRSGVETQSGSSMDIDATDEGIGFIQAQHTHIYHFNYPTIQPLLICNDAMLGIRDSDIDSDLCPIDG